MKHTLGNQAKRAGIALAAVGAVAALGIGTTLAAPPPPPVPTFAAAAFSIESGNGGETAPPAGSLTCSFRETGLHPFQLITYACDAEVVGAVEGCVVKGKLQGGSPTQLSVFQHPLEVLGGVAEGLVSNNKGSINGSVNTIVPVTGGHPALCTEPAEAQVIAVRWCNASLTDQVNNLVGGTTAEMFMETFAGAATVPDCATLATMPPTVPPHQ